MRLHPRKQISSSGVWTAAAILMICVLLTASILGTCMELFTYAREPDKVISLLPPEGQTAAPAQRYTVAVPVSSLGSGSANPPAVTTLAASPSFRVKDSVKTWGKATAIDIFRASYSNGAGVITAAGRNGDKIVAPGTANTYLFHLTNDGNAAIDYKMYITATVSDSLGGYAVPVQVRLSDETGAWLCGSSSKWEKFTALDGTYKKAVLGAKSYSAYSLEWQWPYESGKDGLDTLLGNLAQSEDLVLTIQIDISAQYNPDPNASGGNPKTGDSYRLELWIALMLLSLFSLALLLGLRRGNRREV